MKKLNTKGFSVVEALIVIVVIGLIGGTGWYVYKNKASNSQIPTGQTGLETSGNDNTGSSEPTVESISKKVILTLGAEGEQKTVQTSVKDFYDAYRTNLSKDDNSQVAKLLGENLTEKARAYADKGGPYDPLTCHQYSPMLVIGVPNIGENSATVLVQPVDLVDMYAEKPHTLSLVKHNSKWLIDTVTCPST